MIKANFKSYGSYITDTVYQWDINQTLTVNGLNISVAPEIHFTNSSMDKAIVRHAKLKNNVVTVDIPNSLLQSPLKIEAYIGIYENETFKIIELVEIPVIPKTKPADYQLENSDAEVYSFESLKNSIANMVKQNDYNGFKKEISARVDNLISHNNDTEGNAELIDIRTDSSGTVHKSAGEAVRTQITKTAANKTVKCFAGLGEGQLLTIGYDYIILPKDIGIIVIYDQTRTLLNHEMLSAQLPDNVEILTDGTCKISIGNEFGLIFDTETQTVRIRYRPILNSSDMLLFFNYYSNASGLLVDNHSYKYTEKYIPTLTKQGTSYDLTRNTYIQLTTSGRVKFETQSDGIKIILSNNLMVAGATAKTYINLDDILTQLSSTATKNADGTLSIFVADERALILDIDTMTLKNVYMSNIPYNSVLLFTAYWGNHYGVLVDKYARDFVIDNEELFLSNSHYLERLVMNTLNSPAAFAITEKDFLPTIKKFSSLFKDKNNVESFMFFTDPHLCEGTDWEFWFNCQISILNKIYNSTPTSYIVCGGDWIGNSDTQDEACFKLGYIDGVMKSLFDRYYHVVGNHDTNYQGKLTEDSEARSGTLNNNVMKNLWFRDTGRAFYRFDGDICSNYVLDTQLDTTNSEMDDYKWQQLKWLSEDLISNDAAHNTIFMHITYIDNTFTDISEMARQVGLIIQAYNNRTVISVNGMEYDFKNCTGFIEYVLSGHIHNDHCGVLGGVPCIVCENMNTGFYMCLADYDNNILYMINGVNNELTSITF